MVNTLPNYYTPLYSYNWTQIDCVHTCTTYHSKNKTRNKNKTEWNCT